MPRVKKVAYIDDTVPLAAGLSVHAAAVIAAIALALRQRKFVRAMAAAKKLDAEGVKRVVSAGGLPDDYDSVEFSPVEDNAMYAGPLDSRLLLRRSAKGDMGVGAFDQVKPFVDGTKIRSEVKQRLKRNRGAIFYGPSMARPGVIAHEAGHASIGREPFLSRHRFTQSVGRPFGTIAGTLAPFVGLMASAATGIPAAGIAAGALAGLSSRLVTANEREATRRALATLDKLDLAPEERERNRVALREALRTYDTVSIPQVLAGAVPGLVHAMDEGSLLKESSKAGGVMRVAELGYLVKSSADAPLSFSKEAAVKIAELGYAVRVASDFVKKAEGELGGYNRHSFQTYMPTHDRREQLTPEEQDEIRRGKRQIIGHWFASKGDSPARRMKSPIPRTLAGGVAGGAVGALAGLSAGALVGDGGDRGATVAGAGLLGGGLLGAALSAYLANKSVKRHNADIEEYMHRLPRGARIRDMESDPVYQRDTDRAVVRSQASGNSIAQTAMLAALARQNK